MARRPFEFFHVGRLFAVLLATTAMAAACGGKVGGPNSNPGDAGGGDAFDDRAACVTVDLSSFDTSCNVDTDCIAITTGVVCQAECFGCGNNAAINQSSEQAYESATSLVSEGSSACPCPASGAPRCLSGSCFLCSLDPNSPTQPPGCQEVIFDGGTTTDDAGDDTGCLDCSDDSSTDDAGGDDTGVSDGGSCVFIDPATFDTSCDANSDCTLIIQTGTVCDGSCECGGTPVNVDGQSQYEQDIQGIVFAGCPCAAGRPPACSAGTCVACNGATDEPAACNGFGS